MSYIDGFVQDCSKSSALAMELLQSCIKLSIWKSIPIVQTAPIINTIYVINEDYIFGLQKW